MEEQTLKIRRTGNIYSIASTEYEIIYPDGSTEKCWSPPWHEWDDREEDAQTFIYAAQQWLLKVKSLEKIT